MSYASSLKENEELESFIPLYFWEIRTQRQEFLQSRGLGRIMRDQHPSLEA